VSWLKKGLYASNEPTPYQPQYVDKLDVAVDASTNQARQPGAQSTAVSTSVDELMNEMCHQVYSDTQRASKIIKFNILGDGQ
jgi:hypothetical protein